MSDTVRRLPKPLSRLLPGMVDRYLLAQAMPPFVVSLSAVLAALLLERLLVLFDELATAGSSLRTFVSLLTDLLPHYLGLALPAALCVSVFMIVRRMSDNNEIDALMASGLSLGRIARPFVQSGVILGAIGMLLYGYVQPFARYDFRAGFFFAAHTGWAPHLQSGMFAATSRAAMLTADQVSGDGVILHHVFIQEPGAHENHIITAERGVLRTGPDARSTQLDLWNGVILTDPHPDRPADRPTQTHFTHTVRVITQSAHARGFRSRGVDERELTSIELIGLLRHHKGDVPPGRLRAELNFRLARAIAIPFIPALAAALAIGAKRRRPILGLIAAALILVGFDHTLQFGEGLVAARHHRAIFVIWIPELVFCLLCTALLVWRSHPWRRRRAS